MHTHVGICGYIHTYMCICGYIHTHVFICGYIHTHMYGGVHVFDRVITRRCHHFYFPWTGVKKGTKKKKMCDLQGSTWKNCFCCFHLFWSKPRHPSQFYGRCTDIVLQSLLSLLQPRCAPGSPHTPALVGSHIARKSAGSLCFMAIILICPLKPMSTKMKG